MARWSVARCRGSRLLDRHENPESRGTFFAVKGPRFDGHDFIRQAIERMPPERLLKTPE
jgi:hypothetical protein